MGKKKKGGSKKKKEGGGGTALDPAALAAKRNELEIERLKRKAATTTVIARKASFTALEVKEAHDALVGNLEAHRLDMKDATFNLQREYKTLDREAHDLRHRNQILEARIEQLTLELERKDDTITRLRSELNLAVAVVPPQQAE
eukprot:m.127181 g.127181  ORF g.127181 m.127181 type:complete len:144 (+) comp13593_c0_seq2:43-474(+)